MGGVNCALTSRSVGAHGHRPHGQPPAHHHEELTAIPLPGGCPSRVPPRSYCGTVARSTRRQTAWQRCGDMARRPGSAAPTARRLIVAFLAVVARGAVAAPLNPALGEAELDRRARRPAVSRLLHDGVASAVAAAARSDVPASVIKGADGLLHHVEGDGREAGWKLSSRPDALALLLHTSGTTSKPKTVPIPGNAWSRRPRYGRRAATRCPATTCQHASCRCSTSTARSRHSLLATLVYRRHDRAAAADSVPSTFWDDAARLAKMTWYTAVPTIHARLLGRAQELDGPREHSLRFVRSCSAPLPTALWRRYEEAIGVPLVEAYGMTEAAHQMASSPLPRW